MGYGVFVRPGCGGVKEKVILARYLGAVIPFSAPEPRRTGAGTCLNSMTESEGARRTRSASTRRRMATGRAL